MEADPAPDRHGPRDLPAAPRKPLHLAQRVSGRHGEVSRGGLSAFHKLAYFHTDSNARVLILAPSHRRTRVRNPLTVCCAFCYL